MYVDVELPDQIHHFIPGFEPCNLNAVCNIHSRSQHLKFVLQYSTTNDLQLHAGKIRHQPGDRFDDVMKSLYRHGPPNGPNDLRLVALSCGRNSKIVRRQTAWYDMKRSRPGFCWNTVGRLFQLSISNQYVG